MGHSLEGVRVLDLSQFQAGPSCTQLLAWLGADVIKIEQPGVGDPTRAGVPAFRTTEESLRPGLDSFFYLVFNSNKRSLCLDLKSEEGVSLFMKLAGISDVVVENFGPGRMERFGLGYDRLREVNPRLVFASIKGVWDVRTVLRVQGLRAHRAGHERIDEHQRGGRGATLDYSLSRRGLRHRAPLRYRNPGRAPPA